MSRPLVLKAVFFETGTYENQISRSYKSKSFSDNILDKLVRSTNRGRSINANNVSSVVDEILTIDANRPTQVLVPNGWDTKRLTFLISILMDEGKSTEFVQVLTGYTNYSDLSLDHTMDPDMELYFNNSFIVSSFVAPGPRGSRRRRRVMANDYIIRPSSGEFDSREASDEILIRSEDIFYSRDTANLPSVIGGRDVTDGRSRLDGDIPLARRAESSAATYLAQILRTGRNAERKRRMQDYTFQDINVDDAPEFSKESADELAGAACRAGTVEDHGIFADFMLDTEFANCGIITLGDLEAHCDFKGEIELIDTGSAKYGRPRRGDYATWGGSRREDVLPDIIKNYVVAILLTHNISKANILISNFSKTGQMEVNITNEFGLIEELDVEDFVEAAEDAIVMEVGPIISRNGHESITVDISFDILTGMIIGIDHHDGQGEETWNAAIWSDGVQTNMRADASSILDEIANDASDVIDALLEDED